MIREDTGRLLGIQSSDKIEGTSTTAPGQEGEDRTMPLPQNYLKYVNFVKI